MGTMYYFTAQCLNPVKFAYAQKYLLFFKILRAFSSSILEYTELSLTLAITSIAET